MSSPASSTATAADVHAVHTAVTQGATVEDTRTAQNEGGDAQAETPAPAAKDQDGETAAGQGDVEGTQARTFAAIEGEEESAGVATPVVEGQQGRRDLWVSEGPPSALQEAREFLMAERPPLSDVSQTAEDVWRVYTSETFLTHEAEDWWLEALVRRVLPQLVSRPFRPI